MDGQIKESMRGVGWAWIFSPVPSVFETDEKMQTNVLMRISYILHNSYTPPGMIVETLHGTMHVA